MYVERVIVREQKLLLCVRTNSDCKGTEGLLCVRRESDCKGTEGSVVCTYG